MDIEMDMATCRSILDNNKLKMEHMRWKTHL